MAHPAKGSLHMAHRLKGSWHASPEGAGAHLGPWHTSDHGTPWTMAHLGPLEEGGGSDSNWGGSPILDALTATGSP